MPTQINHVAGDQWRAQDTGYAGNVQVRTSNLDRFFAESVNATHAVSGSSVCSPARAPSLTGQYPLTHGIFVNDVCLQNGATSIAQAFKAGGLRHRLYRQAAYRWARPVQLYPARVPSGI